ncbi:MAG: hypothetical protein WD294_10530 [Phycisphaeraceae bacterium]
MHRSPHERRQPRQTSDSLKDERLSDWHPDRISDRKLLELRNRLEKVRRFGDAFAKVGFSEPLERRLQKLDQQSATADCTVTVASQSPRLSVR